MKPKSPFATRLRSKNLQNIWS